MFLRTIDIWARSDGSVAMTGLVGAPPVPKNAPVASDPSA